MDILRKRASKLISSYRSKDRKLGFDKICDISLDYMVNNIMSKPCVYCGDTNMIGADRIDNNKGHTVDNVVPCCYACNCARNKNFSYLEMKELGKTIKKIKRERMKLLLKRIAKKDTYTIGKLYIDGKYFCDTCEDKDRGLLQKLPLSTILKNKVYGTTAIPTGTYQIDMGTISSKFKSRSWAKPFNGKIPRLLQVPGFEGVLIHPGNKAEDSLGCILVGQNKVKGLVINSVFTFNALMKELKKSNNISITIE